ncbi:Copia protein [Linum grandiflorum]
MLKKFDLSSVKNCVTPMSTWLNFQDETLGKPINEKFYRGMISSLLYLTASRPDIAYRVGVCARFQSKPHESDLKAVKQIFRYLAGTIDILWLKSQLRDFGISLATTPLLCDNTSAINMTTNPVYHSRAKHIDIRHHFIRELVSNKEIELIFVVTESQLADIFTKPLCADRFIFLRKSLGIITMSDAINIEVRSST